LLLAIDGKFEFANRTNPFGGGKPKKPVDEKVVKERKMTLEAIKARAAMIRKQKCQKPQNDS
jgi:hypothetical protein